MFLLSMKLQCMSKSGVFQVHASQPNDIIIYNGESMEEKKADKDFSL